MSGEAEDLAGEYVLGVLDAPAIAEVRRLAAGDPALAADIAAWEARLAPLAMLAPPVAPPAGLWQRIEASTAANDNVLRRAWRSAGVWRAATAAALAIAAVFAGLALIPRPAPVTLLALAPAAGPGASFIARVSDDGTMLIRPLADVAVPSGRDLELWALAAGATRPVPLGLLAAGGGRVGVAGAAAAGTQILVSLEPKGGSPSGLPTGPVLYAGRMRVLE